MRVLVHKRRGDQVVLGAIQERSPGGFKVSLSAAGLETFLQGRSTNIQPMIIAEALRQATILAAHELFDVPRGWAFLMDRLVVDLTELPEQPDLSAVGLSLSTRDVVTRNGRLSSLVSEVVFLVNDVRVAHGEGYLRVLEPRVYARLRGQREISSSLPSPGLEGGFRLHDVSTGPQRRWHVSIDPGDPFFFDHPVDHVPGMILFAAAIDGVSRASGVSANDLAFFDGVFDRFVELTEPLSLIVDLHMMAADHLEFEVSADGSRGSHAFRARLLVRPGPAVAQPGTSSVRGPTSRESVDRAQTADATHTIAAACVP